MAETDKAPQQSRDVAVVVIGRNEGARLIRCLKSITQSVTRVVYVDSGSNDGSVETAKSLGADVVALDMTTPFTAARARNAGLKALEDNKPKFVQLIDGDCELHPAWMGHALDFLEANPDVAICAGRLHERAPGASVYNWLCDQEWNTPIGQSKACGGIAVARFDVLESMNGFNPNLIAGEEPELCVRLRAAGWKIWRLDRDMAVHDAAMTRFGQWSKRQRRAGYAFAEGAAMHGAPPERHWVAETRRALLWGAVLPVAILLSIALFGPWSALALLVYPAQVARVALRLGGDLDAWKLAFFLVLGRFPEARGVIEYWLVRLRRGQARLIEYK